MGDDDNGSFLLFSYFPFPSPFFLSLFPFPIPVILRPFVLIFLSSFFFFFLLFIPLHNGAVILLHGNGVDVIRER